MIVTVEGVVTSIGVAKKDEKTITEILIAQQGEREQVKARYDGDRQSVTELFSPICVTGRLMMWKTRDGVGTLLLVNDDDGNG